MRHDEEVVAGPAIACGATIVVPVLRLRAHALGTFAGIAEADVVAFVCAGPAAPYVLALDDTLAVTGDWNAWLAAQPRLVAGIRARIAGRLSTAARAPA